MIATRVFSLFTLVFFCGYISALQVTPNSPCAKLCIDSPELDTSDPNSSSTRNSDITCQDRLYESSAAGIKWKSCMSCLQNSTFYQGSESDQGWFLYNLRYTFDFCVFGFPNATDLVGSSPCQTSTACGGLQVAMEEGNLKPNNFSMFGYCSANGGAATGIAYNKCLACISASGDTNYVANGLVALEAGCLQKPALGKVVGLNDTIFTTSIISIVDPATAPVNVPSTGDNSPHISTTIIAVVVVVALLIIALIAAFIYIQIRKRRGRAARNSPATSAKAWTGQQRRSTMSFKCQSPQSQILSKSPLSAISPATSFTVADMYPADNKRQITAETSIVPSVRQSHASPTSYRSNTPVSMAPSRVHHMAAANGTVVPLARLNTTVPPSNASSRVGSPLSGSPILTRGSPVALRRCPSIVTHGLPPDSGTENPFITPTPNSATSLVGAYKYPRYNPANYAVTAANMAIDTATPGSVTNASPISATSSPVSHKSFKNRGWSPVSQRGPAPHRVPSYPLHQLRQPQQATTAASIRTSLASAAKGAKRGSESGSATGSPIETRQVQVMFPPPPTRPMR